MRKNNIAKYRFKTFEIGEKREINKTDLVSMKNSLRAYNKNHGLNIIIYYSQSELDETKIIVSRVK